MAKVTLRTYSREIENLVDRGQLDEAIAHCRHILNTFPKHLETYRLLGKAYLEAKRYEEATDIFERVVMAVPDDFVAHVGMSIIQDEQKNMDAAIWHMERAFEVQPSNAAIQSELQRLYGRRDGIEPPKIRLTRGALAHMYVQGELYPQAISEIKSVLEEDSERQDMQALLARAYFSAGQKNESAEVCSQLLRRYPYCLDANRVLVELLPETEQGESVQAYRQRVNELDPYAAFATRSVFHTEEVADSAVSLERLEWDGEPVDVRPDWEQRAGIGRDAGTAAPGAEPDWLRAGLMEEPPAASGSTEEPASVSGDEDIPDFLREAGWGESTGAFQEGPGVFDASDELAGESGIEQGDLPDWVKAMAPAGMALENAESRTESSEDMMGDDVPDWLQGLGSAQDETPAEQPLADEGMPDWLESMKPTEETTPESEEEVAPLSESDEGLPDWLGAMQGEQSVTPQEGMAETTMPETEEEGAPFSEGDEGLPDWLGAMGSEEPSAAQDASQESMAEEETPPVGLQVDEEGSVSPGQGAADMTDTGSLGTSAEEQDDAIAWLEGLASKHGAKPEELVTNPEDRKETEPEWVQRAKEAGEVAPPVMAEEPQESEASMESMEEPVAPLDLPDFLDEAAAEPGAEPAPVVDSIDTGALGTSAEEQDDAIAWLEGLASKHGAKPEELVTKPEDRMESEPEWVQRAKEAGAVEPAHEEQVGEPALEEPVQPSDTDETGMWLRDLGEAEFIEEQETTSEEAEPIFTEEAVPDWLNEMERGTSQIEPAQTSEAEAEVPDWLRGMDAEPSQPESPPALLSEEALSEPGQEVAGPFDDLQEQAEVSGVEAEVPSDEARLSDWLQNLDAETAEAKPVEAPAEKASEEDLPFWLADLAEEADQKAPAAAPSDELPDWLRAEAEEEPGQPQPTTPADWQPVEAAETTQVEQPSAAEMDEGFAPEPEAQEPPPMPFEPEPAPASERPTLPPFKPEPEPEPKPGPPMPPERESYREPVTRSRSGMTGMLSPVKDPALTQAQNELTRGNIPGAMENYGKLIKKGKMLDEVIFDLREALYRYPVEVNILQTLGDAYMRANRLQDALDSYTKAEELLR